MLCQKTRINAMCFPIFKFKFPKTAINTGIPRDSFEPQRNHLWRKRGPPVNGREWLC